MFCQNVAAELFAPGRMVRPLSQEENKQVVTTLGAAAASGGNSHDGKASAQFAIVTGH